MDIANIITKHIDANNYDDLTKVRWIYLFICSLFSYDIRFVLEKNYKNEFGYNIDFNKLRDEIYNKKIDITNIEDFEIVCSGIAHVLIDALALYGFKATIEKDPTKYKHVHVVVKVEDYYIKLDPMLRHDNTRVKLNFTTKDFTNLDYNEKFDERIKEIDKNLDYYNKDFLTTDGFKLIGNYSETSFHYNENYNDLAIKRISDFLHENTNASREETLINKVEIIKYLINNKKDLVRYDDVDFYMSYLFNNLFDRSEMNLYRPSLFWNIDKDGHWNMMTVILLLIPNHPVFYKVSSNGKNFEMSNLDYSELEEIFNSYEGINKEYIRTKLREQGIKLK